MALKLHLPGDQRVLDQMTRDKNFCPGSCGIKPVDRLASKVLGPILTLLDVHER